MNKIIGYVVAILGLAILAIGFGILKSPISLPESLKPSYIMIAGIALVIIGLALSFKRKHKGGGEVPIYQGNKIVGYRR